MSSQLAPQNIPVYSPSKRARLDALAMFVYINLVYLWAAGAYPLGRDFEVLASGGEGLPLVAKSLFRIELSVFGGWAMGYHLVNMALMYVCMLLLYRLVTSAVKGPAWLGVFAANLFMANPLHTESMLNISGVGDLIPCVFGLAALVAYAHHVDEPTKLRFIATMGLGMFAALAFPSLAFLPTLFLLYEGLVTGSHRRSRWRMAGGLIILITSVVLNLPQMDWAGHSLAERFTPIYFTFYCLGFLPETVWRLGTNPWTGWIAAGAVITALIAIHLRARRPAFMFALLGILLLRLGPIDRPVDWVHLVGGGQLLLHQALFMLAVAAIYLRVMEHPKWRQPLIYSSFSVSVVFFLLEAVSIWHWREAGTMVRDFQHRAAAFADQSPEPFAVTPAYTYYKGAPLQLSDAIAYDTPYSAAITHRPVWHVQYETPDVWRVELVDWSAQHAVFDSHGLTPTEIRARTNDELALNIEESGDTDGTPPHVIVTVEAPHSPFPDKVLESVQPRD